MTELSSKVSLEGEALSLEGEALSLEGEALSLEGEALSLDVGALSLDREDEILRQRAEKLARVEVAEGSDRIVAEVAVVESGGRSFGILAAGLREIVTLPNVVPLPQLPPIFVGLTVIRGEFLCVLDLAAYLGVEDSGESRYGAVVQGPQGALVLAVNHVVGFRQLSERELADWHSGSRALGGLTKDLIELVDLARLFENPSIKRTK